MLCAEVRGRAETRRDIMLRKLALVAASLPLAIYLVLG